MVQARVTRRLAAILVADIAGYSQLMERDELASLSALKAHRKELIDVRIAENDGRIVKLTGDGFLVEFASVVDAVTCASEIQAGMTTRNAEVSAPERLSFRIGVHLGDVIVEGDDLYGDGVNVAARLEGLAEPGGICISQQAFDQVGGKLDLGFVDLGEQRFKNIARPIRVYRVELSAEAPAGEIAPERRLQEIRFCAAPDGVQIAYASVGEGPPLVKTANWLNHLEYDWQSPVWRHFLRALAKDHRLVRYDARGNGLSDWNVEDISFEAFVGDLEAVVDAAGLTRFPLIGVSQGCAVSVAYAVRHPERVTHLVLYGGFTRGFLKRGNAEVAEKEMALLTLMRHGWGQENPAFRQIFTSQFIPDGTPEQVKWFNDLQRMTTSPENAARIRRANAEIDITDLAPRVTVPTLVLHCRDEVVQPFEEGRRMAAMIPGARFVALEGRNHLILENEPAWSRFQAEVLQFLKA